MNNERRWVKKEKGKWRKEESESVSNKSSKDRTWSAVPDALLGVIR